MSAEVLLTGDECHGRGGASRAQKQMNMGRIVVVI